MSKLEKIEDIEVDNYDFEFCDSRKSDVSKDVECKAYGREVLTNFIEKKKTIIALIVIGVIVVFSMAGPAFSRYKYNDQIIEEQNMAPRIPFIEKLGIFDGSEKVLASDSEKVINMYEKDEKFKDTYHWFGSDGLGRDIWTRTWVGARISLYIALIAVIMDLFVGLCYGMISGYFGGKVDAFMQRFIEIVSSIPYLVVITLLLVVLSPGLSTITLSLMITGWIGMSRVSRAHVLKQKNREYVLAAKSIGNGSFIIIFKEILPNIFAQVISNTIFSISDAIFTEAFLSFVGLGIPSPLASIGSMISEGYKSLTTHSYQIVPPLIVLILLMLSFNILADSLRDTLDLKKVS